MKSLLCAGAVAVWLYLMFALAMWQLSPYYWDSLVRGFMAVLICVCSPLTLAIAKDIFNE